jgi:alpha-beta hydrolase superfamily lysophospholipase
MGWPQATEYNAAIQNPQVCFSDPDLRRGQAAADFLGLPRPHAGNFADVYQIVGPDGQAWAVKCFTRPLAEHGAGLRLRYQAVSNHLRHVHRPFMVNFHFLEEGIRVRGEWFPIVKMRWVEGLSLNAFVREHLDRPALLERLAQIWLRLSGDLREAGMAHGDLQHGNVLLIPGSRTASLALRLIDYDGLCVPALLGCPSGEVGHPNYQHPQRLREGGYGLEIDRFAHLVIYTALRCLRVGGRSLWERHDSGENLLFREDDFRRPLCSRLLPELLSLPDPDIRALVSHLLLASQSPLERVPVLGDLANDHGVLRLTTAEEGQVRALLPAVAPRKSRLVLTAQPPAGAALSSQLSALSQTKDAEPTPETAEAAALAETAAAPVAVAEDGAPSAPPLLPSPAMVERETIRPAPRPDEDLFLPPSAFHLHPLLASLAAILCLVLATWLAWSFTQTVAQPTSERLPQPTSERPRLLDLPDVALLGGEKREVPLGVERHGHEGSLVIHVEGLPEGMKCPPLALKPGQTSVTLHLLADLDAEMPRRDLHVSLWEDGQKVAEQRFGLSVRAFPRPRPELLPLWPIVLHAGKTLRLDVPIDRRGCTEPLRVAIERLPQGMRQQSAVSTDLARARIDLTADADASGQYLVQVLLLFGDAVLHRRVASLAVEKDAPLPRLVVKGPLRVKAGESKNLWVEVDRHGYEGEVRLELRDLPSGVRAVAKVVPARQDFAAIEVRAEAGADVGERGVHVVGWAGQRKADEQELTLTVEKRPAVAVPEGPAARPPTRPAVESVRFTTVDRVRLRGDYYRGGKGKQGACVLLLHDLGSSRKDAGVTRLAESLQDDGHTVLTFDFRGHGESRVVEPAFWDNPVHHRLSGYRKGAVEQPATIDQRSFPASYLPWLIHDIAAARLFLEMKHDDEAEPVNASNLIVVGSGKGAALGILWLATECHRHRLVNLDNSSRLSPTSEAQGVSGAVWLGLDNVLGELGWVSIHKWAVAVGKDGRVPTLFLCGANDEATGKGVKAVVDAIGDRAPPTAVQTIPGTADTGKVVRAQVALLLKSRVRPESVPLHVKECQFWWVFPLPARHNGYFPAKEPGADALHPVPLEKMDVYIDGIRPTRPLLSPRSLPPRP